MRGNVWLVKFYAVFSPLLFFSLHDLPCLVSYPRIHSWLRTHDLFHCVRVQTCECWRLMWNWGLWGWGLWQEMETSSAVCTEGYNVSLCRVERKSKHVCTWIIWFCCWSRKDPRNSGHSGRVLMWWDLKTIVSLCRVERKSEHVCTWTTWFWGLPCPCTLLCVIILLWVPFIISVPLRWFRKIFRKLRTTPERPGNTPDTPVVHSCGGVWYRVSLCRVECKSKHVCTWITWFRGLSCVFASHHFVVNLFLLSIPLLFHSNSDDSGKRQPQLTMKSLDNSGNNSGHSGVIQVWFYISYGNPVTYIQFQ